MTLTKIPTHYLLDSWAEAPARLGFKFVVERLRTHGCEATQKEAKQAVYERLVLLGLLDPDHLTPRNWKRAKQEWSEKYSGSAMQ